MNVKQNSHYITGHAIMPNHLHALIAFSNTGKNMNQIIENGKRFMAYDIAGKLKEKGNENRLDQLTAETRGKFIFVNWNSLCEKSTSIFF